MQCCKIGKMMLAGLALGVGLPAFTWTMMGRVRGEAPLAMTAADGQPPDRGRNNRQPPPPPDDDQQSGDNDRQPPGPPQGRRSDDGQGPGGDIRTNRMRRGWPLIPPPIERQLHLTSEQRKQVADLEKEVHGKLMSILTDEQKQKLKTIRMPFPPRRGMDRGDDNGGFDRGPQGERPRGNDRGDDSGSGRGRPPQGDGPPGNDDRPPPPDDLGGPPAALGLTLGLRQSVTNGTDQGIQWYPTWDSGLRAARESGKPILLVSAAPHCAGIPGIW
jgi:hypothetical protein